jgi:hypothetical protein
MINEPSTYKHYVLLIDLFIKIDFHKNLVK